MAAELGDAEQMRIIIYPLCIGRGEVSRRMRKRNYHLGEAAIGGRPHARHNLGVYEERNGRIERAVKHYVIAANLGLDLSIQGVLQRWRNQQRGFCRHSTCT